MTEQLTLQQITHQQGVIIDTRCMAFYNGWPMAPGGTSGHEPGAHPFAANWLSRLDDDAIRAWACARGVTADTPIAFYGMPQDCDAVRLRFGALGFNANAILTDVLTAPSRLVSLPGFHQRVSMGWLNQLLQGHAVAAKPPGAWRLVEVTTGEDDFTLPGATQLDIRQLESGPLWNVVPASQLAVVLAEKGLRFDTTVILCGRNLLATARAAHILLYAGVVDVRLLDGDGFTENLPCMPLQPPEVPHGKAFGATIPAHPELMINMAQAQNLLHREDASLVSIRSWAEHCGQTSGYDYIGAKGDIPGARWGHAGEGKNGMDDFLNPDGTLRCAQEIAAMWQACNITPDQHVAFYCGTGWRASLAFMCARAMGWTRIAVYDGGWLEWSQKHHHGETC